MLLSLTIAHRLELRWLASLLAVILSLSAVLAPSKLTAQSTEPQEITSQDIQPTFKLGVERNLVIVRAVVRDKKGLAVDNLRQENFQIFDRGKPQAILNFSVVKPALSPPESLPPKPAQKTTTEPEEVDETTAPASAARRFLALYFDDVNTPFADLARARDAANRFLSGTVQPGNRVALYTSSGQKQIDFTANVEQVRQGLFALRPRPIAGEEKDCGAVPPYQAYLILDLHDSVALELAIQEVFACRRARDLDLAQLIVSSSARRSQLWSDAQSTAALRGIESVVRRLASLPGERSMIIASAGFLTQTLRFQLGQIIDRALQAGVVINALDARGLYGDPTADASVSSLIPFEKRNILLDGFRQQAEAMFALAHDTGGIFYENDNDLEAGFRKTAGLSDAFYLMEFSPQNLRHDGAFHAIKVALVSPKGFSVQSRRGYYAPNRSEDPALRETEEIREALFSRDETHTLPIDVHTQFFMKTESDASITVQTSVDLRPLHVRKEGDRNVGRLKFVTALFDQDGREVSVQEKILDLRMRDSTLERYRQTGIAMEFQFDVRPGTYLVRAVVRDSESGQVCGLNRTVEIPY